MQTLKEVIDWFVKQQSYMKPKAYRDNLMTFDCEWEIENEAWEAWYIRWYEVALKELQKEIKTSQWNIWWIPSFIQNLLDN